MALYITNFDLNLAFSTTYRTSALDKYALDNTFSVPKTDSVLISITLNNLDNFNSTRLVAAFFLLYFLSQKKPYVTKFGIFQTFKKKRYDIHLQVHLRNYRSVCEFLAFFSSTLFFNSVDSDINKNLIEMLDYNILKYTLSELSFLKLVEMHPIFFKWKDKLDIQLIISNKKKNSSLAIENFLKIS